MHSQLKAINPYWAVVLSLTQTQKKRILMRRTQAPNSGFHLHWKRGRGEGRGFWTRGVGGGGGSSFHFLYSNACLARTVQQQSRRQDRFAGDQGRGLAAPASEPECGCPLAPSARCFTAELHRPTGMEWRETGDGRGGGLVDILPEAAALPVPIAATRPLGVSPTGYRAGSCKAFLYYPVLRFEPATC